MQRMSEGLQSSLVAYNFFSGREEKGAVLDFNEYARDYKSKGKKGKGTVSR